MKLYRAKVEVIAHETIHTLVESGDIEVEHESREEAEKDLMAIMDEFLRRERAKLRRLSQTPAREMTMPDPEEVRADLAGKIPVDPRHLKPRG